MESGKLGGVFGIYGDRSIYQKYSNIFESCIDKSRGNAITFWKTESCLLGIQQHSDECSFIDEKDIVLLFHSDISKYHAIIKDILFMSPLNKASNIASAFTKFSDGSLVIYDDNLKLLTVLTDIMGFRKIFYTTFNKTIFFSSSLRHLVSFLQEIGRLKDLTRSLNTHALKIFLSYGVTPIKQTIIDGIFKLQLGSNLIFHEGNLRFNAVPSNELLDMSSLRENLGSERGLIRKLYNMLMESVLERVENTNGVLLSGGLDSAVIASLIHRITSNFMAVNISYGSYSENHYAQSIADALGVKFFMFKVEADKLSYGIVENSVSLLDEPHSRSNFIGRYLGLRFLASKVKGAFLGEGGDELFAGYWLNRWRWYSQPIAIFARMMPTTFSKVLRPLLNNFSPPASFTREYNLLYAGVGKEFDYNLCAYFAQIPFGQIASMFHSTATSDFIDVDVISKLHMYSDPFLKTSFFLYLMLTQSDVAVDENFGSRLGLKIKLPYLDLELAKFLFSLSNRIKLKNNVTKYLLRRVAEIYSLPLPNEIIYRGKQGFPSPFSLKDLLENSKTFDKRMIIKKCEKENSKKTNLCTSLIFLNAWLKSLRKDEC